MILLAPAAPPAAAHSLYFRKTATMSYKRSRMPHNNRVAAGSALKTTDIWSKTIGHNPYSTQAEQAAESASAAALEKSKGLLELARHQNLTGRGGAVGGDDFARKMFLGLKGGKKRRADEGDIVGKMDADTLALLEESSSDEDDPEQEHEVVKHTQDGDDGDASSSSSSENDERRKRRRRKERKRSSRHKHRKKEKKRKHNDSDSSRSNSSSEDERRKKRHRKRDRDKKRRHEKTDSDHRD